MPKDEQFSAWLKFAVVNDFLTLDQIVQIQQWWIDNKRDAH